MCSRGLFSFLVLCAAAPLPASAEVMSLAEHATGQLSVVEIHCDGHGDEYICTIGGTRISKVANKPLGAIGEPNATCYLEVGMSVVDVTLSGNTYIASEGPAGSICQTQLITTIDFTKRKYILRKFSRIHTGEFCKPQVDETHVYTAAEFAKAPDDISCAAVEAIPSMWEP
jgi:hypothetical protein